MRILLASSEVHPYSKTGGLADMTAALAKMLARAGHQVGIVTPLYSGIRESFLQMHRADWDFEVLVGTRTVQAELYSLESPGRETAYFIRAPEYFNRAGLYGENDTDYPDNAERFTFFSKCVAHLARHLPWKPEIVHVHDWQTGLVPLLIAHQAKTEGWGSPPHCCLTIHNLAYQGTFPRQHFALTNLPWEYFNPEGVEFYGMLNCLKAGLAFSDALTTVSPRYAREITTEEFGCGLDGLLRKRQSRLSGILNGVDYEEWNTTNNPHIKYPYSADALAGKALNKSDLQAEVGLPVNTAIPLFGTITRLAEQKGIDIELGALEEMLRADMQFVLLGGGSQNYERAFRRLSERFPRKVSVNFGYNHSLAQRIEAGCDFYLMPSRFEPCGLNQMYSLRYGTIPIVRAVGGLDDTIVDASQEICSVNGIKFYEYSAAALAKAMRKALVIFEDAELLNFYRRNAMACDFAWAKTVRRYEEVYQLAGRVKRQCKATENLTQKVTTNFGG